MPGTAAIVKEGKWYVAGCLEVEVASQGKTVEEAAEHLKEALELYFEDAPHTLPGPSPMIAPLEIDVPAVRSNA